MGVYYAIGNDTKREYLYSPYHHGVKWGEIFDYQNPTSRLTLFLIATSWNGDNISLYSDGSGLFPWEDKGEKPWRNITQETIDLYLEKMSHERDIIGLTVRDKETYDEIDKEVIDYWLKQERDDK